MSSPNHDGTPRAARDRLFGVVDPRIGRVVSASATSRRWPTTDEMVLRGGLALILGCVVLVLANGLGSSFGEAPLWSWITAFALAGAIYWITGPTPRCSYVGERGALLIERHLRLFPRTWIVLFDDAWDARVEYIRVYRRGYGWTIARFTWVDDQGDPVTTQDATFREAKVDTDDTDLAALAKLEPANPVVALGAALRAFHAFVDAENAA